jgi:hypothetical protein
MHCQDGTGARPHRMRMLLLPAAPGEAAKATVLRPLTGPSMSSQQMSFTPLSTGGPPAGVAAAPTCNEQGSDF